MKVGGYVVGNLLISVIAGALTLAWSLAFGVPYAVLLAIAVAVLDLIPVVGSVVGGVLVSLVAIPSPRRPCCCPTKFCTLASTAPDRSRAAAHATV